MSTDRSSVLESWLKFLNPDLLRSNLIAASIYLAAWETFRRGVISHLEGFYMVGFDQDGFKFSDDYSSDVLCRDKSPFRASMLWLLESGAIDQTDLMTAERAREHRNEIAHDLPQYLANASHNIDLGLLGDLCNLMHKIDLWWIRNVEIPTNPDFDNQDADAIPDSEIKSGNMFFLDLMLNVASGNDGASKQLLDEFKKQSGRDNQSGLS